jgi:hypothetical protein
MPEKVKGTKGLERGQKKYLIQGEEVILNPDEIDSFLAEWENKVAQDVEEVHKQQRELYRFREQGRMVYTPVTQNTDEWSQKRLGSIGGSGNKHNIKGDVTPEMLLKTPYAKAAEGLYKANANENWLFLDREMTGNFSNHWTQKGHYMEEFILTQFKTEYKDRYSSFIEEGMITLQGIDGLHFSPDLIILKDFEWYAVADAKTVQLGDYLYYLDNPFEILKKYNAQLQQGMLMLDVDMGYIIIGHERCPNIVVEVKRDEAFIYKMVRNFNSMLTKREDVLIRRRDIFSDKRLNIEFKAED